MSIQAMFNELPDKEKVTVLQEIMRHALMHMETARAKGSSNGAFGDFFISRMMKQLVIIPLELTSGWSKKHTDRAQRRAKTIHDAAEEKFSHLLFRSPGERYHVLESMLLNGNPSAAGMGNLVVARAIRRARNRMKQAR